MRNFLRTHDFVFVDIDDTLVYGFFTKIMHYSWNLFHSPKIAKILIKLQAKYKLYRVNRKLVHSLRGENNEKIIFLTVRAESDYTTKLVRDIMPRHIIPYTVVSLGSDYGHIDKANYIYTNYLNKGSCILIDDNELNRKTAEEYGIDTFNPKLMLEEVI